MAVYFIKSKTPLGTQDGSVQWNGIQSNDDYNKLVADWKLEVAKVAGCGVDDVEILTVNKL